MKEWKARVRAAFARSTHVPEEGVIEELAQHLRAAYEAGRAEGLSHAEAERRAAVLLEHWRLEAGALRHRSHLRPAIVPPSAASASRLAAVMQDVRYAGRLLRHQPRYALLVILTMALGIGATTALFSVTYGLLIKPLPWRDAGRLVVLTETRGGNAPRFGSFSNAAYLAWREHAQAIEDIAAWSQRRATLAGSGDPERILVASVSASLFRVLSARPLIGSLFEERDEMTTEGNVIVLSEGLWRQRFGGAPDVVGRLVQIDGQPHRVAGVLPDRLAYPDRQTRAWVPYRVPPSDGNSLEMFDAIARLRDGVTPAQAAEEGTARGRFAVDTGMTTVAIFGGAGPVQISAVRLADAVTSAVRRPVIVLLAAVALLLATAIANVASLQLARTAARRRELAIRAALGAGRARLTRQLVAESLLTGLAGGGAGLTLAWLLHRLMPSVLPADFPRVDDIAIDPFVVLFASGLSVLAGILAAVLPALRVQRLNLIESLAEDGTAPVGSGRRSRTARMRTAIMAGQVAIACVLLVGAALLGRSFVALLEADRGYDPSGVLTGRVALPAALYTPERRYVLLDRMLSRLAAVPAVVDAAFTSELPLAPGGSSSAFTMRSRHADTGTVFVQASPRIVSPRYFPAIGMRIAEGRTFTDADTESSQPVVIVNRTFARQYLGGSALGARLPMAVGYQDQSVEATVVGVADDVRYPAERSPAQPEMYYSYRQFGGRLPVPVVTLLVRTRHEPAALAATLRTIVRDTDDGLVPEAIVPMDERLSTSLARPRLYAFLLGGFAVFALAVAAVGLFAVLSYTVAQRSRELAVRTALGARQVHIVGLVFRQGLAVAGAGLAAGLLASAAFSRSMEALLYGVSARDLSTYFLAAVIIVVAAAAACVGPAWRAARLDPLRALRG